MFVDLEQRIIFIHEVMFTLSCIVEIIATVTHNYLC